MNTQHVLVTGGAGFIGANLVNRLVGEGHRVTILDTCSRPGSEVNLAWLAEQHGQGAFLVIRGSIEDFDAVRVAAEGQQRIYHLAGQVAVTTSVAEPRADFSVNACGTLNVLEAARTVGDNPIVIYASTNKVYGALDDVAVVERPTRYELSDLPYGVAETRPLDFHSPYGCSKGCGDQYVRDYARIYGLRTVVARQSCIYGPRQFGMEDQGWLAWFMIAALLSRPIAICGSGKQVRDVLYVDDLLDAYDAMVRHIDRAAGKIYNVGGGPANTVSVWAEFGPILEVLIGRPVPVQYSDARPGDQSVYVSDIRRASTELGWQPSLSVVDGLARTFAWVSANRDVFEALTRGIDPVAAGNPGVWRRSSS